ncbi:hypothetical protein [Marinobacter alkaliphilus]|uniref:Glycosyltransferase RgtA/B/C/D-like domain-containing protein n=1 Tax=Marinobacter alkaliphilus TaxID=254719 RepID=A0ABZ3DZD6_9GAMM
MKSLSHVNCRVLLSCSLLIAVGVVLYSSILGYEYVWDDTLLFVDKVSLLNEPLSWELISQPVLFGTSYFRPFVFLSWYVEFQLWGQSSAVSHAIHLVVYILNCLLVYGLARVFLVNCKNHEIRALLAALVYACHPVLIETTAWISGRFDLFVSFFIYLAVLVYFSGLRRGKLLAIGLCFVFALFSKELGVVLPFVIYALWMAKYGVGFSLLNGSKRFLLENKLLVLMFFFILVMYFLLRSQAMGGIYHRGISWFYVTEAYFSDFLPFKAPLFYLYRLMLPFLAGGALHPYEYYWVKPYESLAVIAFTLVAFFILLRGLVRNKKELYWLVLSGVFCLSLVLHIIPLTIGENLGHDRFLSTALAFFVIAVFRPDYANFLIRIKVRPKVASGIVGGCLAFWFALVVLTHQSLLGVWKDEFSLWQESYRVYPDFKPASYNYVYSAIKSGRFDTAEDVLLEISESRGFGVSEQSLYADLLVRKGDPEALRYLEGLDAAIPDFHEDEYPLYMLANFSVTPKQLGGFYSTYSSAMIIFEGDLKSAKELNSVAAWYLDKGETLPLLYQKAAIEYLSGNYEKSHDLLVEISGWHFSHKKNLIAFFETLVEKYCGIKKDDEPCENYVQKNDQWLEIETQLYQARS